MVEAAPEPSVGVSVVIVEAGAVASVVAGSSPEPSVVAWVSVAVDGPVKVTVSVVAGSVVAGSVIAGSVIAGTVVAVVAGHLILILLCHPDLGQRNLSRLSWIVY